MHITETQVRGRWNLSILCNESRPKITRKKSELYRSSSISSSFISKSNTKNNKINNSKTKFFGRIHDNDNENYINEHLIGKNYYIKPLNIYQDTRSLIDSKRINIITLDENSVSDIVVRSDDFENKDYGLHEIIKETWSNNFSAPVDEKLMNGGARVLDCGVDLSLDIVLKLPRYFEKSKEFDLINVLEKPIEIGSWGGENGEKVAECLISTWIAFKSILKTLLNVDDKGFDQLINQFYNDTRDVNNHMICKSIRIYGRKKFT
ncbi:11244_t:CDS:2 [Entrophospora sp. SA101]|nr:11244_t:CDS:2 [Entrophospora sp. SA101]